MPQSEAGAGAGVDPQATAAETTKEPETTVSDAVGEVDDSVEETTSQTVAEELENLDLNKPTSQVEGPGGEDEGDLTPEEDDGEGEWISSFLRLLPLFRLISIANRSS